MQNTPYQKGFTLVETLVAISILVMVIVGPMTIAQKGIQNAYFANDQVTAVFLAQEAIEGVRELRDEKALKAYADNDETTADWVPLSSNCDTSSGCAFVPEYSVPFQSCLAFDGCKLYVDSNGVYSHTVGESYSPFTRKVTIGGAVGGGVSVEVLVTWEDRGAPKEVKLQTWIYNHYQRYEN